MEEDILLLAGPQFSHGHWLDIVVRCVVKRMSMAEELSGKPSVRVAP